MKAELTSRGFSRAEFIDRYRSKCSIQDSSLASEDAIWLGVDTDFDGKECTRMHLTRELVRELLPLLQAFAETGSIDRREPGDGGVG
jgi:hypothetical protein